jgi:N-acetyl-anhydromuramyl-L-alanine amidase AmpD
MNERAIGICFIGNFDEAPPPTDQWAAGVLFVRSLCRILMIPITNVVPHRDFAPKTCPGKMFDIELFRRDLLNIA